LLDRENIVDQNHIDFLSLDTEGNELKILQSIDFDKFNIDVITVENNDYDNKFYADGGTALLDAILNGIESTGDYAQELAAKRMICNAVLFAITDGDENSSTIATINCRTMQDAQKKIAKAIAKIRGQEVLESIKTILIGIADPSDTHLANLLSEIKTNGNIDEFVMIRSYTVVFDGTDGGTTFVKPGIKKFLYLTVSPLKNSFLSKYETVTIFK
jgi:hypothetical protein